MPDVFTALADPTRRHILERLHREGPSTVSELTAPLAISRQAVTKHLAVLHDAGLLEWETRGRERVNRAVREPLDEVTRWIEQCSAAWDTRLAALQTYLEQETAEEDDDDDA